MCIWVGAYRIRPSSAPMGANAGTFIQPLRPVKEGVCDTPLPYRPIGASGTHAPPLDIPTAATDAEAPPSETISRAADAEVPMLDIPTTAP